MRIGTEDEVRANYLWNDLKRFRELIEKGRLPEGRSEGSLGNGFRAMELFTFPENKHENTGYY